MEVFSYFQKKSRELKLNFFFETMQPGGQETLLDIGGGLGQGFDSIYNYFSKIKIVDINKKYLEIMKNNYPQIETFCEDGCKLSFADKSMDYVFSNAVIEHVGDYNRQGKFANEIMRIAKKGYFVTTPNFGFPLELHNKIPFWHFIPLKLKRNLKPFVTHYNEYSILTASELRRLFPSGNIIKPKVTIIPETLIVWEKYR